MPEFRLESRTEISLEEAVGQTVGAASMCWSNVSAAGVFQSEDASKITDELITWVKPLYNQPLLGLATTRDLLKELEARLDEDEYTGRVQAARHHVRRAYAALNNDDLDYRTVDDG